MNAPRFSTRSRIKVLAAAGLGLTGTTALLRYVTAHDDEEEATYNQITIHAHDFTFELPESVPAGWTSLKLINDGVEPHHAQMFKLPDGMTFEEAVGAFATDGIAFAFSLSLVGGPSLIDPGLTSEAILNLDEGTYLITCFIESPDGLPHLAKGMMAPLVVTAAEGETAPPAADVQVDLLDFAFSLPQELPAGRTVFEVVNNGVEPHEIAFFRLAEGVSPDAVFAMEGSAEEGHDHGSPVATAEPPVVSIGGLQAIDPGLTAYTIVDFEPATYVATCFIPSFANEGAPHFMLGMVSTFTVS